MMQITVNFRDGTKRILPDPAASVIRAGEWRAIFGEGVVQIIDPDGLVYTWPLDLVQDVQEVPQAAVLTAPHDDDVPEVFRGLEGRLDLAEAIAKLEEAKDAGTLRHWLIVWVENDADPAEPRLHHTHFEDEIVGLGLAEYAIESIHRSWESTDEEEA